MKVNFIQRVVKLLEFVPLYKFYKILHSAQKNKYVRIGKIKPVSFGFSILVTISLFSFCFGIWFHKSKIDKESLIRAQENILGFEIVCFLEDCGKKCHWKYSSGVQSYKTGFDCSNYVIESLKGIGVTITTNGEGNGVSQIYAWCEKNGFPVEFRIPRIGDVVFWDFTRSLKNNGKLDPLTHCGIVEYVFPDNSFVMIEAANESSGIRRNYYHTIKCPQNGTWQLRGFVSVPHQTKP